MPNPRVAEMRRRAWEMFKLAMRAKNGEEAERILDEFTEGKICGEEALRRLRALAEAR